MSDGIKAFWLGVFIIITMAVAAWLLLFLKPRAGDCGQILHVRFSNIQSVSLGTRVTYGGKAVGEVIQIKPLPDARLQPADASGNYYLYELELCVDSSVKVFNTDEITFSTMGLMGEKSIAILPKSPAQDAPTPYEVTDEILYAKSSDLFQEAILKLTAVADVFEITLKKVNAFMDNNSGELQSTLKAVHQVADSLCCLINETIDADLVQKVAQAAQSLSQAMGRFDEVLNEFEDTGLMDTFGKIGRGEGTLGRLLHSDCFYLQLSATLCKLQSVLNDINNYGLLFQYDRKWKRKRLCKEIAMQRLCDPQEALALFNQEMSDITQTLDRINRVWPCIEGLENNPCEFTAGYKELMCRVEYLMEQLKNYREQLINGYCEGCY